MEKSFISLSFPQLEAFKLSCAAISFSLTEMRASKHGRNDRQALLSDHAVGQPHLDAACNGLRHWKAKELGGWDEKKTSVWTAWAQWLARLLPGSAVVGSIPSFGPQEILWKYVNFVSVAQSLRQLRLKTVDQSNTSAWWRVTISIILGTKCPHSRKPLTFEQIWKKP